MSAGFQLSGNTFRTLLSVFRIGACAATGDR
jgi:hypothetical protein